MNIWNVICVSFITIFQQVIALCVEDLSEFIIDQFERAIFVQKILEYIGALMFK